MNSFFSSALVPRALLAAALMTGPALYLSGCGGGGGNNTGPSVPATATPTPTSVTPTPTPTLMSGQNQILFSDDFSSPTLDSGRWGRYTDPQELQATRFGNNGVNMNEGSTSFTRLTLDSYNPDAPGQYYRGTEIYTFSSFTRGDGLEFEARLRGPNLPPGIVFAFFTITDRYNGTPSPETYSKDEIDYEFLTAQQQQIAGSHRNFLYTNTWNNWNLPAYNYDSDNSNNGANRLNDDKVYQASVDPALDFANWNTYKIHWLPDRTEFYVNGTLERTETEVKPDEAMPIHFNIWAPMRVFSQAFSSSLPGPVSSPSNSNRKTYAFDVDYVRVTALSTGAGAARVAPGAAQPLPATVKSYRLR